MSDTIAQTNSTSLCAVLTIAGLITVGSLIAGLYFVTGPAVDKITLPSLDKKIKALEEIADKVVGTAEKEGNLAVNMKKGALEVVKKVETVIDAKAQNLQAIADSVNPTVGLRNAEEKSYQIIKKLMSKRPPGENTPFNPGSIKETELLEKVTKAAKEAVEKNNDYTLIEQLAGMSTEDIDLLPGYTCISDSPESSTSVSSAFEPFMYTSIFNFEFLFLFLILFLIVLTFIRFRQNKD